MNNIKEEDELFTCVEPVVSYYSSSSNIGVTEIHSKKEIKPYNVKYNSLFTTFSPKNNFSLCNTVMIPFITNRNGMEYNNNNYNQIPKEHINQNITSRSDDKKIIDNNLSKKNIPKENTNLEKNPFFLGRNLSTNYIIEKQYNDDITPKNNNELINESVYYSKIDGELIYREACKSVNESDIAIKNKLKKENNKKKDKSDLDLIKQKKIKIKDRLFKKVKSSEHGKDLLKSKLHRKKTSFFRGQPDNVAEETKKEKKEKKNKKVFYSNKMVNKNYNENYFKTIIKHSNCKKIEEEKENENENKHIGATERKKNRKCETRTPLKNNYSSSHFLKIRSPKGDNDKINKIKNHSGLNILKAYIKIKEKENNEDVLNPHSSNVGKEKHKIPKKKLRKKKSISNEKNNKDSDSDEKRFIKTKTPIRRISAFSKFKFNRKNIIKDDNFSCEKKALKMPYIKRDYDFEKEKEKEKDKDNSKSNISMLENNKTSHKHPKTKMSNSILRNDISLLRNAYDDKDVVSKGLNNLIKKKRSISVEFDKTKMENIAKTIKENKQNQNNNKVSSTSIQKKFDFESVLKKNSKKMQFNLFSKDKFTNTEISNSDYLKYTLNCMELIIEIDMDKQPRLKNKINFNFPKPKKKNGIKKKIALFDLDETLVHCTGDIKVKKEKYQNVIEIKLPGKQAVQVGLNVRPLWKQTLKLIGKFYHIVIYTASHQAYADAVLDFMDPKKKYFKYRLYRNNCSLVDVDGAKFYVKDLDVLNEYYDLKDVVIIDNSVLSFAFHLHNGIPIVPYYDEDKDGSLYVVGLYLLHIFQEEDLREANKKQINLDSFLEEAKKQKEEEEEENIIEEEVKDEEEEKSQNDSKKNNIEAKNGEEINRRKVAFSIRKKTIVENDDQEVKKRLSQDLAQKKLMSQSKLINMYYEVKEESTKNLNNKTSEINEEENNKNQTQTQVNNEAKGEEKLTEMNKENSTIIIVEEEKGGENGDLDCKSDLGYPLIGIDNDNNSDNDSISDENLPNLRRGFTITARHPGDKERKNSIIGKLKYIRSNFFNNFKI